MTCTIRQFDSMSGGGTDVFIDYMGQRYYTRLNSRLENNTRNRHWCIEQFMARQRRHA